MLTVPRGGFEYREPGGQRRLDPPAHRLDFVAVKSIRKVHARGEQGAVRAKAHGEDGQHDVDL